VFEGIHPPATGVSGTIIKKNAVTSSHARDAVRPLAVIQLVIGMGVCVVTCMYQKREWEMV